MRHRARRLVALLLAFSFAHITWTRDAAACASVTRDSAARSAASMDDMDMSAMEATNHAPASNDGCSRSSTPAQCQAMAPCVPMVLAAPPELSTVATRVETSAAALVVLAPPSRSLAPESPPPRA
jgi:hypothetical protein